MKRLTALLSLVAALFMLAPNVNARLNVDNIKYQKTFTSGGKKYTIYWEGTESNIVNNIYIVPDAEVYTRLGKQYVRTKANITPTINGKKMWPMSDDVPKLKKIIVHDLPGNNDFIGALVYTWFQDGTGVLNSEMVSWEIKLPDDIANEMLDLVDGKKKLKVISGGDLERMFFSDEMQFTTSSSLQSYKIM